MSSPERDYDLLLEAPSPVDAALATELLEQRGIPTISQGPDRYSVGLGESAKELLRPDLYVPKGMYARARAILTEAWGDDDRAPIVEGTR